MEPVTISTPCYAVQNGVHTLSAVVTAEGRSHEVFYRTASGPIAGGSEPFIAAALLPAMRTGAPLTLPGPVSLRLLDHLPVYQSIVSSWFEGFHTIPISAAARPPALSDAPSAIGCFFSAGVDSFYSVLTHRDEITHLVYVRGYDHLPRNAERGQRALAGVRAAAAELNKPLIEVQTNVRDVLDKYVEWRRQGHGAVLGSVALLLSPQLRKIYIASTRDYISLHPLGSHPLLDPLWSSDEIEVIHDGGPAKRRHKVRRIANDPIAMRWLRVCWEKREDVYNCGQCEKCLRTMIELYLNGALERCATFPHTLDYECIASLKLDYRDYYGFVRLLDEASQRGDAALEKALRQCLGDQPLDYREMCHQLELRILGLEQDAQRVYSSRSWRMTAPLRTAGHVLRRLLPRARGT